MTDKKKYTSMRKDYNKGHLKKKNLMSNPFEQFDNWMQEAIECDDVSEANIMTLATANKTAQPSARQVLLKDISEGKLIWYTNLKSRKGHELSENPQAALLFWWEALQRQVRIEGEVSKVPDDKCDKYFASRPRGSQVAAMISPQSEVVKLKDLKDRFKKLESTYTNKDIPRPSYWGGFGLLPESWEFWQGRPNRLHDRLVYEKIADGWEINRLGP